MDGLDSSPGKAKGLKLKAGQNAILTEDGACKAECERSVQGSTTPTSCCLWAGRGPPSALLRAQAPSPLPLPDLGHSASPGTPLPQHSCPPCHWHLPQQRCGATRSWQRRQHPHGCCCLSWRCSGCWPRVLRWGGRGTRGPLLQGVWPLARGRPGCPKPSCRGWWRGSQREMAQRRGGVRWVQVGIVRPGTGSRCTAGKISRGVVCQSRRR